MITSQSLAERYVEIVRGNDAVEAVRQALVAEPGEIWGELTEVAGNEFGEPDFDCNPALEIVRDLLRLQYPPVTAEQLDRKARSLFP